MGGFREFATGPDDYKAGIQAMMRNMLADRFKLVIHRSHETRSVYALIIAKGGIRFREATAGVEHTWPGTYSFSATKTPIAALAKYLTDKMDAPVVDTTGLNGVYDLSLNLPSLLAIPAALGDQLGLKIEQRKAPIEILVVDHAEQVPIQQEDSAEKTSCSGLVK